MYVFACVVKIRRGTTHAYAQLGTWGTPAYQGPEVLRRQPVSKKLDLYGFAIMLWEM